MPLTDPIVIATRNAHKLREITRILTDLPGTIASLADYPDIPEIEETGDTFEANALIKARAVFAATGKLSLSDDSGLEVDALDGAPGVYSARYAGPEKSTPANNARLLQELGAFPGHHREAQFRCVVAIVGDGIEEIVEGIVRGRIAAAPRGTGGFGYDPLFIPDGYRETFAELGRDVKNRISHRARAFQRAAIRLHTLR